ncbi:dephospho-CoA kinase [Paenibacillus ginsengihumi]|jgi:dephospho-CoA kinase|uniref:dephospho-CoA kinase n=1 Tax=Paenibacillus ginsengihumi TaxID=431596 RepID=UPI00036D9439|nr:dephospho-CoA kinase [Paenibacillus ginsengihumi]
MKIGLTGGIATGKSTVASMLQRKGAPLVDADVIAREVVEPGSPVLGRVAERFGSDILLADGSLNRKKLGAIVFADPTQRKALESLLHPPIRALMKERMALLERQYPDKPVIVDVPLLYESGLEAMFDAVMVVYVPAELQRERLKQRDGLTEEQAEQRLAAQLPIEEKRRRADFVIDNAGTLEETQRQIDLFWKESGLP